MKTSATGILITAVSKGRDAFPLTTNTRTVSDIPSSDIHVMRVSATWIMPGTSIGI